MPKRSCAAPTSPRRWLRARSPRPSAAPASGSPPGPAAPPDSSTAFAERRPGGEIVLLGGHSGAFAGEEVGDRLAQALMGDVVRRPGLHRLVAAGELVPALGTGLDPGQAERDRRVDRLVVAQLEVQERLVDERAPIAPVERVGADEVERPGDRLLSMPREDQQDLVAEPFAKQVERGPRQVRPAPLARSGVLV